VLIRQSDFFNQQETGNFRSKSFVFLRDVLCDLCGQLLWNFTTKYTKDTLRYTKVKSYKMFF